MDRADQIVVSPATRRDLETIASLTERSDDWVSYAANRGQRSDVWIWVAGMDDQLAGLVDLRAAWAGRDAGGGSLMRRAGRAVLSRNSQQPDAILQPYQFGFIHDLVVVSSAHYGDIGAALVNECIAQMQQSAIETLQIDLNAKDEAAQELCQVLDFRVERHLLTREIPEEALPTDSAIRQAEMSDLSQLSDMMREELTSQLQQEGTARLKVGINWEKYVAGKLKTPNTTIFVFEENGRLGGYMEMWLESASQESLGDVLRTLTARRRRAEDLTGAHIFIVDIFVKEAFRKQGVAGRLLWQAGRRCQQLGIKEVRAAVWAGNKWWLALGGKMGWQEMRVELMRPV